ncbi:hypothetical protein ACIBCM_25150 [Streptomyces sp. NPDC051018]|uniref:hypothetical protein n=1 Tax=Streptomyces sp. NPDC051018 TaxID=3365639 RepID=UPI0037950EE8
MTDKFERLRVDAAGREYGPVVRLARALYEDGLSPEQVLRECYGVDFPREFFAAAAAGPYTLDLLATLTNQPWQPAIPPTRGGPAPRAHPYEPEEQRLRAVDPDLLPLVFLIPSGVGVENPHLVLCYRLSELASGRSTVYGIRSAVYGFREEATMPSEAVRRGDSLLTVLLEHHTDYVDDLVEMSENTEGKGEYDLVHPEELKGARSMVDEIKTLQRAAETGP